LTLIRHALCASPSYLEQYGTPNNPSDLQCHVFLRYGLHDAKLQINDNKGGHCSVPIQSKMTANNGDFLKLMAAKSQGIVQLPTFMVYQELAEGKLVTVLDEYQLPAMNAYAVYPRNRFLPERCRRFIDFLSEKFGERPYWDS